VIFDCQNGIKYTLRHFVIGKVKKVAENVKKHIFVHFFVKKFGQMKKK
jgi:hypothetical protein